MNATVSVVLAKSVKTNKLNKQLVKALDEALCAFDAMPGIGNRWGVETQMVLDGWKEVLDKAKEAME